MRGPLALAVLLAAFSLCAQDSPLEIAADANWREALARADREKKPIVVFFTATPCDRCITFARAVVPHPGIQRRLPAVVFATLPAQAG